MACFLPIYLLVSLCILQCHMFYLGFLVCVCAGFKVINVACLLGSSRVYSVAHLAYLWLFCIGYQVWKWFTCIIQDTWTCIWIKGIVACVLDIREDDNGYKVTHGWGIFIGDAVCHCLINCGLMLGTAHPTWSKDFMNQLSSALHVINLLEPRREARSIK